MEKSHYCVHVSTYLRDMCSSYFGLSHRKTCCVCKVQYTPMVPCDPQTNSGNCFQWKRVIRNTTELVGWAFPLCVWLQWERMKPSWRERQNKRLMERLREQDEIVGWSCQIYVKLLPFTQSGHRTTHLAEIYFQAASWISLCVHNESFWRNLSREQGSSSPQARTMSTNDD